MNTIGLTAFLESVPRPIAAIVIGVAYGASVGWRFRWPMSIDGALLLLYLWRPSLGLLAWIALLISVRHIPTLARETATLLRLNEFDGWTTHVLLFVLPALAADVVLMSRSEDAAPVREDNRTGTDAGSIGSLEPVRAQSHQLEPDSSLLYEPVPDLPSLHRMSRAEEIAMLTVQRNDDGGYRHSANKIAELMGGTAADVKGQVAAIRGPAKPAEPPASARVVRPVDGWRNKAS
jgi:hypothetical protein